MASNMTHTLDPQEPTYINDIKVYHKGLPGVFRIESENLDVRLKAVVNSHGKISDIQFKNRNGEQMRDQIFADIRGSLYFTGSARLAQIVIVMMGISCETIGEPERVSMVVGPDAEG
ncbi:hypothetical protein NXS19_002675 [Fusarium pseudograminearum]|uniref:Uncharacterized protein n=1 Tax=Fusarium pseudograminearum (strain CS3096) TaxID=1028729 RepID=K3V214_FUSPC|nr:hypothetical protein FPSE_00562 [Fusarium pseudograminearum CS3096]EKJ79251.1 hypothetical protein FPSE_00562 [Fusarium pseudograminearum CS3096]KAF0640513.1 hypothetical protein FPSE5266_00562 [Fusarium pseudograminearum]QPC76624.1 hypothetical protein HYE68_007376 [Fusarium pseudograminearum]UZP34859.1 hypothetical protein NXS19_002675 [Fusarium pseudograminearum]